MQKEALQVPGLSAIRAALKKPAVVGGVGLGAGLTAGGIGGYGLAKHRWQPGQMAIGHPETGQYAGDLIGPSHALEELRDDIGDAQEEADYEALQQALQEAEAGGIVFKGAAARNEESEAGGRYLARGFSLESMKIGAVTASMLKEAGALDEEDAVQYEAGTPDRMKLAELYLLSGMVKSAQEQEMTKEAFGALLKSLGQKALGWGGRATKGLQTAGRAAASPMHKAFGGGRATAFLKNLSPEAKQLLLGGGAAGAGAAVL